LAPPPAARAGDRPADRRAWAGARREAEAAAACTGSSGDPRRAEPRSGGRVLGWLGATPRRSRLRSRWPSRRGRRRAVGRPRPRHAKRYAEAEAEIRRALALDPGAAEASLALGDVLGWQQRYREATAAYEAARAQAPTSPEPWLGLAKLRFWQDDLEGARTAYEAALALDPANAEAADGLRRIAAIPPPRRVRVDLGYR
jgi:tetratricopeptide (TPR) repeat protein